MANAKLLPSQVLTILRLRRQDEMRSRHLRPTLTQVGSMFGVSAETVRQIEQRKTWKKLVEEDGINVT